MNSFGHCLAAFGKAKDGNSEGATDVMVLSNGMRSERRSDGSGSRRLVGAQATIDLIAGQLTVMFDNLPTSLPHVKERLLVQGAETVGDSPEQFAVFIQSETANWGKVIRDTGIKLN